MVIAAAQRRRHRPKSHAAAAGDNRPARRRRWSKGLTPPKRIASARMSISTRLRHWQSKCDIGNIVQFWLKTRVAEKSIVRCCSAFSARNVNFNCRSTVSGSRRCSLQKSFSAFVICPWCRAARAPSAGFLKLI